MSKRRTRRGDGRKAFYIKWAYYCYYYHHHYCCYYYRYCCYYYYYYYSRLTFASTPC